MTLREVPIVATNVGKTVWFVAVLAKDVWLDTLKGLYGK